MIPATDQPILELSAMTIDEAINQLDALAKPGDFALTEDDTIRTTARRPAGVERCEECPVCWLASQLGVNEGYAVSYWFVATPLGLSVTEARTIARAADGQDALPGLREKLLKACKLT